MVAVRLIQSFVEKNVCLLLMTRTGLTTKAKDFTSIESGQTHHPVSSGLTHVFFELRPAIEGGALVRNMGDA
jgi:hypothetical protein